MKRIVSILLVTVMLFAFAGCGESSQQPAITGSKVTAEIWDDIFGNENYRNSISKNVELILWDQNSGNTAQLVYAGDNFLINDGRDDENFIVVKDGDTYHTYDYDFENMQWVHSVGEPDSELYVGRAQIVSQYVNIAMPELIGKFSEATYDETDKKYTVTVVNQYDQTIDYECWFENGKLVCFAFANEEQLMKATLDNIGRCALGAPDEFVEAQ